MIKCLSTLSLLCYPLLVYLAIHFGITWAIILIFAVLMSKRSIQAYRSQRWQLASLWLLATVIVLTSGYFSHQLTAKLLPVVINSLLCALTWSTLFSKRPLIERFARITYPELPEFLVPYCRCVTQVWTIFFGLQALITLTLAYFASTGLWTLYTSIISYLLIVGLLLGEYGFRRLRFPHLEIPSLQKSLQEILQASRSVWKL